MAASKLSIVKPASTGTKPARKLGNPGTTLWNSILAQYDIADAGGLEMLESACAMLDRAESLRERIDADGEIIETATGVKEHPGMKQEIASRAFVVRTLGRLGLDLEPVKPVGRPPGGYRR